MEEKSEFVESQSLVSNWLIVVCSVIVLVELYYLISEYQLAHTFHGELGFWLFNILIIGLFCIRLKTRINDQGIEIRFIPFIFRKRWSWAQIAEAQVLSYSIFDYGGWGVRFSLKGMAYTAKGNRGIQLVLKNGRRILIGTQQPREVEEIVTSYLKSSTA